MIKFILLAILIISASAQNYENPSLVIELCRHGARGPLSSQYDNTWPPDTQGELTPPGMRQHYLLGSVLSNEYPDLLVPPYFQNNVEILSDNCERCIQSALSQFYGIYLGIGPGFAANYPPYQAIPPYNSEVINETVAKMNNSYALPFNNYPAIIPYVNNENEIIFDLLDMCPNANKWAAENEYDVASLKAWKIFSHTILELNKYGRIVTPDDLMTFADTVYCDLMANKTLPGGMPNDPSLIENMTFATTWFITQIWSGQTIQQQVSSWGFTNAVLNITQAFVGGDNFTNFVLFSGHDTNILVFLAALGVINSECVMANYEAYVNNEEIPYPLCYYPMFASTVKFELYNTSTPYVRTYYNDVVIPLCGSSGNCEFNEFVKLLTQSFNGMTIEQLWATCGSSSKMTKEQAMSGLRKHKSAVFEQVAPQKNSQAVEIENVIIGVLSVIFVVLLVKLVFDSRKHNIEIVRIRQERSQLL